MTPDKKVEESFRYMQNYFDEHSKFCSQSYLTPDTWGIIKEALGKALTQYHQDLMSEERKRVLAILDEYDIDGEWQRNQMLGKIADDIKAQTIIKSLSK